MKITKKQLKEIVGREVKSQLKEQIVDRERFYEKVMMNLDDLYNVIESAIPSVFEEMPEDKKIEMIEYFKEIEHLWSNRMIKGGR